MFNIFKYFRSNQPVEEGKAREQGKEWEELPLQQLILMDEEKFEQYMRDDLKSFEKNDFLGKAADAKHDALTAVKAKQYDKAWRLFHEQKLNYMKHASRCNFTRLQTLALDGSVSEHLADVLRLEGKHTAALIHIVYWVASSSRKTKRQEQKLQAYFRRANLKGVEFQDLEQFMEGIKKNPDFRLVQDQMRRWE